MHDLDRTQLELGEEAESDELLGELLEELTEGEEEAYESESGEMELAAEFLEISDEEELDQFLGALIGRAFKGAQSLAKSPAGQQVKRDLKKGLKKAATGVLPSLGKMAGGYFGDQGARVGEALGGALQGGAEKWFGLELEGLSPEDQEFEVARRFVRFAKDAAGLAVPAARSLPPQAAARAALKKAARKHAPGLAGAGLAPGSPSRSANGRGQGAATGRWVRRGQTIELFD